MREKRYILIYLLTICLTITVLFSGNAGAEVLYEEDFTDTLTWSTSDASVYIKDNDFLFIGTDGGYDDFAEKIFSIDLSNNYNIIIEQRIKLDSSGRGYTLSNQHIYFEDDKVISVTYLPSTQYGWNLGGWTKNHDSAIPGEGYWAVTKIIITPSGGELYVKPDDSAKGWFSNDFVKIVSKDWSYDRITKIVFRQHWDSVNYFDYIKITKEMNIPVDTNPPSILISSPSSGQSFDTDTITVSGTAFDDSSLSKIEVKVGSGSWQSASGTTSWSKSIVLNSGSNTIYARATDTSENTQETSMVVNYDLPTPTPTITTTTIPTTPSPTPQPTATSKDSDGDGWSDEQERTAGTNPFKVDTDGDGIWDSKDSNPLVVEKHNEPVESNVNVNVENSNINTNTNENSSIATSYIGIGVATIFLVGIIRFAFSRKGGSSGSSSAPTNIHIGKVGDSADHVVNDHSTKTSVDNRDGVMQRSNIGGKENIHEKLTDLKEAFEKGLISKKVYEEMQKELLGKM